MCVLNGCINSLSTHNRGNNEKKWGETVFLLYELDHLSNIQHKAIRATTECGPELLLPLTVGVERRLLSSPDCSVADRAGWRMSLSGASIRTDVFSWLRDTPWPQTAATGPVRKAGSVVVVVDVVVVVVDVVVLLRWALAGERFFL